MLFALIHCALILPDLAEGVNWQFCRVSEGVRSAQGGWRAVGVETAQPRGCPGLGPRARSPPPGNAPQRACQRAPLSRSGRFRNPGRGPHRHTVGRCTVPTHPAGAAWPAGRAKPPGAEGSSQPPAGHQSRRGLAWGFGRRDSAAGQDARRAG